MTWPLNASCLIDNAGHLTKRLKTNSLRTHLELGAVLLHQEVQLKVMEVIQVGFIVTVHKKQRFVDKLLENVLHLLRLKVPQNRQHLGEGITLFSFVIFG